MEKEQIALVGGGFNHFKFLFDGYEKHGDAKYEKYGSLRSLATRRLPNLKAGPDDNFGSVQLGPKFCHGAVDAL